MSDGWHTRTTVAKAAAVYTVDLNTWNKLRVDLHMQGMSKGFLVDHFNVLLQ